MIRALLFHPLGVFLLLGSLFLAGTLRFLPWAGDLSTMAPWVLFLGATGYTALVVALLWPGPETSLAFNQQVDADLSDATVEKRLRSEAVRHPATLLSLALAVISACYLALLASAFGWGLAVMATAVVAVAVAAGTFLCHYVVRHRDRYTDMVDWLTDVSIEAKARAEEEQLAQLRKHLEEGFPTVGSDLGLKTLLGLDEEFLKLGPVLENRGWTTSLSLAAVPVLAGETYRRGLSVLADALELMKAVDGPTREELEAVIANLESEIKFFEHDRDHRTKTLILEDTLASHRQRLGMQDQLRLRADQLLHLASRCEATLNLTRIQVVGIKSGGLESSVNPAVEALQETVRRAKEVQEELQKLGY